MRQTSTNIARSSDVVEKLSQYSISIAVLYKRTHILRLMTSCLARLFTWFAIAILTVLTNSPLYKAIALLFLVISSIAILRIIRYSIFPFNLSPLPKQSLGVSHQYEKRYIVLLPDNFKERYFGWQIEGGARKAIVLASLIVFCSVVPQVETDLAKFSASSIAIVEESLR